MPFTDKTSGPQSYGGGRYLFAEEPADGAEVQLELGDTSRELAEAASDPSEVAELAETARSVEETKDFSLRVERRSQDELGARVAAFNRMLGRIQIRDQELVRHRRDRGWRCSRASACRRESARPGRRTRPGESAPARQHCCARC